VSLDSLSLASMGAAKGEDDRSAVPDRPRKWYNGAGIL